MSHIKSYSVIAGLILLAGIIGAVRELTSVPVSFGDLVAFPGALIFSIAFLRYEVLNKDSYAKYNWVDPVSRSKKLGILIASVLLFFFGLCSIWFGILNPFAYHYGPRGACHGYTLIPIGMFLAIIGAYGVLKSILIYRKKGPAEE